MNTSTLAAGTSEFSTRHETTFQCVPGTHLEATYNMIRPLVAQRSFFFHSNYDEQQQQQQQQQQLCQFKRSRKPPIPSSATASSKVSMWVFFLLLFLLKTIFCFTVNVLYTIYLYRFCVLQEMWLLHWRLKRARRYSMRNRVRERERERERERIMSEWVNFSLYILAFDLLWG